MEIFLGIIIGLVVLVVLVVLHELGHAVVAVRNGVVVEEFGIGFPPRAWKKKLRSGVLFTLNWLPIGGFVRLKGEYDSATGSGTYGGSSFWVKTKILLAGVLVNWITAALLFTVLLLVGLPKILPNQVVLPFDTRVERSALTAHAVTADSPAARAGIVRDDEIICVGGSRIETSEALIEATRSNAGQSVEVAWLHDGQRQSQSIKLNNTQQAAKQGYLGVSPRQTETIHSTWSAPILGVATTVQLSYETVKGIGTILGQAIGGFFGQFVGSEEQRQSARDNLAGAGESVAGPVGILGVLFPSVVSSGFKFVVLMTAIISLTLAVMNILPVPALDGGRWFTMAGFRLFRKELTKEREEAIQTVGFLTLMALTVLVTWSDVAKLF